MASAIFPGKFEDGDIVAWLREFDACSEANSWKVEDKIKKLPAFLRGQAASHFYAISEDSRKTYADAVKKLTEAMCPKENRETFFAKFEARSLRPGEDPSVYRWELEQILLKAEAEMSGEAKEALLTRQFMRGLPKALKIKLLQDNPTPDLMQMVSFVQRHRAVQDFSADPYDQAAAVSEDVTGGDKAEIAQLVALVTDMAVKQRGLEEQIAKLSDDKRPTGEAQQRKETRSCFNCGRKGHISRNCFQGQSRKPSPGWRNDITCFECKGHGHVAKDCANRYRSYPLND